PNYVIQGATYSNVGDALGALDRKVSDLDQRVAGGGSGGARARTAVVATASVAPDASVMSAASEDAIATVQGTPTAASVGSSQPLSAPAAAPAAVNAVVMGDGAVASGASATAIGQGATAS